MLNRNLLCSFMRCTRSYSFFKPSSVRGGKYSKATKGSLASSLALISGAILVGMAAAEFEDGKNLHVQLYKQGEYFHE